MNYRSVLAVVAAIVVIIAGVAGYCFLIPPSESFSPFPDGAPPNWRLNVTGNVDSVTSFTLSDLKGFPLVKVNASIGGVTSTYTGVDLYGLLMNHTEMFWDTGAVEIISKNGSSLTTHIFDIWTDTLYPDGSMILAFAKDGRWMTEADGTVMLIAPRRGANYQVMNIVQIKLNMWPLKITGKVQNPFVITHTNITDFEPELRMLLMARSTAGDMWANWTGVRLSNIIEAAHPAANATALLFRSIDAPAGAAYTWEFYINSEVLLCYKFNDEQPIPYSRGGPWKLAHPRFADDPDFMYHSRRWFGYITEIEVVGP